MKNYPIFNKMIGKIVLFYVNGNEIQIRVEKFEGEVIQGITVGTSTGYHCWIDVASIQAFSYAGDL